MRAGCRCLCGGKGEREPSHAGDSQGRGGGRSGRGRRARTEVTPGAAVPEPADAVDSGDAAGDAGLLEARGAGSPYAEVVPLLPPTSLAGLLISFACGLHCIA